MEVNEIRPRAISELQKAAYAIDFKRYAEKIFEFIPRACPGCGSTNSEEFCNQDVFRFERCKSCFTVFMNPGPTESIVKDFYENSVNYEFWSREMYPKTREARRATLHMSRAEFVKSKLAMSDISHPLRILEVGAGTGDSISVLKSTFYNDAECFVIEPNPNMWPAINENGLKTVTEIANLEKQSFDLILAFEVLEHVLNPLTFLRAYSDLLKKDGLLIISTPNSHSLEVQLLKENSTTLDIEHISVMSPAGIHSLSNGSNLRVVEITTPGEFDMELINSHSRKAQILESLELPTAEIQNFIAESRFSSHMKVVFALNASA